jgi:hypothetical protein
MKEKLAFITGTGASLLGIALVANGMEQVQFGSAWEVPAAAAGNLLSFDIISVLLYLVRIVSYFTSIATGSRHKHHRTEWDFGFCCVVASC